ncbi:helicase-related protein [Azospirillum rugosum]|uniref:ATP-dependent RNA helicase SUPV3L1/SUV3 n=1 Tax=Azospirillum rugosum TaxID=416170 RepID=A0ABS4SGI5_9PROT|nr:helicase-related protein [Azospirillum rugosum]MBP2291675.1 ATP-dependent RNA helicase SUPV3L1/SUV3 [Azospirillum rugosum]MDQ0524513.1 ATP-dependent RNA helicase SUPV3L1/SUV3 [Azospirillum rugosum]
MSLPDDSVPHDPNLVHELASAHPDVVTPAAVGVARVEHAERHGLVPLGLPLPRGKRDLLVPAERREAILLEIEGLLDRARRRNDLLAQGRRALEGWSTSLHPADDRTRLRAVRADELPWPGLAAPVRLQVSRTLDVLELADLTDEELTLRLEGDPALSSALEEAQSRVAARLHRYAAEVGEPEDGWTFASLAERLSRAARNRHGVDELLDRWDREFDVWRWERAEARGRAYVDRHFDFARFERLFPVARGLGRRLVLVVGPTNSGKTHHAIEALKGAYDGVYLAPLRLLALEVMERLNAEGTPASLLTGEEAISTPGARHTASTIEVMDPDRPVEVAVIDEIQMLADPDRGWAWTAALMGAPAETVYILGAPEARPLVERAAAHLGERLEVVELERKVPLTMIDRRLNWEEVEPGDALIAFSRREVHAVRDTLRARGMSVAAVYGALAPEVRRREAARFLSGEADVVVATDAIGMGLNLPCRRVLFTALEKFDGSSVRPLTATEVKQIAGRAGRFGKFESGEFGVVGRGTPQALRNLLEKGDPRLLPTAPLTVRPTRGMLARLADHLGTEETVLLVDCFADARTGGSPYRVGDLSGLRRLAVLLDERRLPLAAKLDLLLAPADLDEEAEARILATIIGAVESGEAMPIGRIVPARLDGLDGAALEAASRACDLYYWAARKFPTLFPEREAVRARRAEVSRRLSDLLATRGARSAGNRREPPPKAGFRGAPRKRFGPRR